MSDEAKVMEEKMEQGGKDVLVFAPNNTLGVNSAGIGALGVRMPRSVIWPPARVDATDFINVPTSDVSHTTIPFPQPEYVPAPPVSTT